MSHGGSTFAGKLEELRPGAAVLRSVFVCLSVCVCNGGSDSVGEDSNLTAQWRRGA